MNDLIFDRKAQAAKSSIDDALGVAQRVQQLIGTLPPPAGTPPPTPAPGQPPQQHPQAPGQSQQPQQTQQPTPGAPPPAWPSMPGANPLLQQLASQYSTQQAQAPQTKSFARGGLAVFG